ncbi:sensor histidine kinase [Fertoeibacter niger]|uniref:sensor histidine kinase n=1 Tax=Fertoeibacter niger TaxID=2656921 RepID=UPI00157E1A73|nr:two-component regulator propeller domain-containing protein [Fertoeibacter niger]
MALLLWTFPVLGQVERVVATIAPDIVRITVAEGYGQRFTRLSTSDGLSQTRVAQIVQDKQGYMWFGTQFGLNRYDGYDFKTLIHDRRNRDSIGAVFVTALFVDRDNGIWVGGTGTLDRLDPVTETVARVTLTPDGAAGDAPTVVHISQDREGAIWLATGAGLFRHDPLTVDTRHYRSDPDEPDSLSSNRIQFSGEDRAGNLWVGSAGGLDRLDPATGRVTLHVPLADSVQVSFYEDQKGNFWVLGATGTGLARLDRSTNRVTRFTFHDPLPGQNDLTGVMGMVEDDSGALWIGSPGLGLFRLDAESLQAVRFGASPSDPGSIPEDKVIGLFKDREGNIWSGHHSAPPSMFNPGQRLFETFRQGDGRPDSLQTDFINAIFEDDRGQLWLGNDFGLTRVDRATGQFTRFHEGLSTKPMVISIAQDRAGQIWVGTYGNGIARLDEATGNFERFVHDPADPFSIAANQVHRLILSRDGTLWAGTGDGLSRFDPATGRFTTFKADWSDSLAQTYVSGAEDAEGNLWLGTHYSGLHRFDPRTGKLQVFAADPSVEGSLRDNMVPSVHIGTDGIIWVGTQSGLDRFDPATGRFEAVHEAVMQTDRTISHILEDEAGTLWIGTNKGVVNFDPADGSFADYQTIVGLSGNDFTGWASGFQSARGEMFFGGFSGGVAFFPAQLAKIGPTMPILLTELEFPFLSPEEEARLEDMLAIGSATALSLGYHANSLSLTFAAPSFVDPGSSRYRYMLEGLEDDWREVDATQRRASYTMLPPGRYVFRAQAAGVGNAWSTPGIALPIVILPPWWQTWWARSIFALGVAGLIAVAFRIRTAQVEQREQEFRKLAENAPDMVLRFDSDLRLFYANSAARAFIGPEVSSAMGRPLTELTAMESRLPVRRHDILRVRDTRVSTTEEYRVGKDAAQCDIETRIVPETSRGRSRIDSPILVIARDVSQRNATELALRRAEADLAHALRVATVGELTASIAHEINQPLTGIVTNGEAGRRWLTAVPPNLPEGLSSIEAIIADGRRAAEIIDRVVALVRRTDTHKRPVNVNDMINEAVAIARAELTRANVVTQLELDSASPQILADRVQIQQVLLNLFRNALEAMATVAPEGRILNVTSRTIQGRVIIGVRDTGPGLGAEAEGKVFEAFYSTKPTGMGMGLAISRSIVHAQSGEIRVNRSVAPGCLFEVEFAVLDAGAEPCIAPAKPRLA